MYAFFKSCLFDPFYLHELSKLSAELIDVCAICDLSLCTIGYSVINFLNVPPSPVFTPQFVCFQIQISLPK